MKLLRYRTKDGNDHFGVLVEGTAVSFRRMWDHLRRAAVGLGDLDTIESYLAGLPESERRAKGLVEAATAHGVPGGVPIDEIRFLPPIPTPPAIWDFGLSPRHLRNSSRVMFRHEWGPFVARFVGFLLSRGRQSRETKGPLRYFKANHLSIIGSGDEMGWPSYSSYLDIEPELGIVVGTNRQPIAGYVICNNISARDVQWPEMMGTGPARSKDFERGQGLGPFLVTPDEVGDPLDLHVTIDVGGRHQWTGSTSEYTKSPDEVVSFLETILPPIPGMILGMGTVPDCSGMDHDLWIEPGDRVEITFEKLGTLVQLTPTHPRIVERSRWAPRPALQTSDSLRSHDETGSEERACSEKRRKEWSRTSRTK